MVSSLDAVHGPEPNSAFFCHIRLALDYAHFSWDKLRPNRTHFKTEKTVAELQDLSIWYETRIHNIWNEKVLGWLVPYLLPLQFKASPYFISGVNCVMPVVCALINCDPAGIKDNVVLKYGMELS